MPARIIAALACLVAAASLAAGGDWAQWRGPAFNGSADGQAKLPEAFGKTQNVAWTAALPGVGASTPAVVGQRVFLTAQDSSGQAWAIALDRANGKDLWKRDAGKGFTNRQGNTAASPSPVCDDKRVYFLFGNGELFACDFDGKEAWRRNIQKDHGKFDLLWDYSASALLHGGRLYLAVIHGGQKGASADEKSYVLCIDAANGKDLWKRQRPSDAKGEARQAYTTPQPLKEQAGMRVVVVGANYVTAHDPASGAEAWRDNYATGGVPNRIVPSPVCAEGVLLVATPRGGELVALEVGAGQPRRAWSHKQSSSDVPTPVVYDGKFFVLDGTKRTIACIEPKSGKVLGRCELGGKSDFQASPTAGDGKIYCLSMSGELVAVSADSSPKVLHRAEFGGRRCRSSVAISDGQLFVRTDGELYCLAGR